MAESGLRTGVFSPEHRRVVWTATAQFTAVVGIAFFRMAPSGTRPPKTTPRLRPTPARPD